MNLDGPLERGLIDKLHSLHHWCALFVGGSVIVLRLVAGIFRMPALINLSMALQRALRLMA